MVKKNDRVVREAVGLLKRLGIEKPPIDVKKITGDSGLLLSAMPDGGADGVSGMLIRHGNHFGILYATHINNEQFQRFSIGHELGHFFLPGHHEAVMRNGVHQSYALKPSTDYFEREANQFASALLMPPLLFEPAAERHEPGLEAVRALSEQFDTSLTTTAIEYVLRTSDIVAIVVSAGGLVEFSFLSHGLWQYPGVLGLKKGSLLPASLTKAFNAKACGSDTHGEETSTSELQDWFGGSTHGSLVEEVIGLGRYGRSLTVLTPDEVPTLDELEATANLEESWEARFK